MRNLDGMFKVATKEEVFSKYKEVITKKYCVCIAGVVVHVCKEFDTEELCVDYFNNNLKAN